VARINTVLVYRLDSRWYVTAEVDDPQRPTRRWYELWWNSIRERYTARLDVDELRQAIESVGLDPDPAKWRGPTKEEKRPRRDG
jgi:hypothetical protein